MWDALQTLYEGREGVKDSKINIFIEEFELFRIEPRESIDFMHTSPFNQQTTRLR